MAADIWGVSKDSDWYKESPMNEKVAAASATNESIIFPSDLNNLKFYPEQMKFSIFKRSGIGLEKVKNRLVADGEKYASSTDDLNKSIAERKEAGEAKVGLQELQLLDNAIAQKRANLPKIDEAVFSSAKGVAGIIEKGVQERKKGYHTETPIVNIWLPMAKEVTFNDSVSWAGTDLGGMGALLQGEVVAGGAAAALSMAALGASAAGGGILGKILGSSVGGTIAGVLAADGLQKGIESAVGIKANPYKEQTFEGIDFRKFSFSYMFQPKNQTEVNDLDTVIRSFRAYSKPSISEVSNGIFNYPHEFQIEFLTHDSGGQDTLETNIHLPELKYCICTNVSTNFATREWRSFDGGGAAEISLQLDFEETELITQEDVLGNTKVGRFSTGKKRKF